MSSPTRREFLAQAAGGAALAAGLPARGSAEPTPIRDEFPPLETITGTPTARGKSYGTRYRDEVRAFLRNEIYGPFDDKASKRGDMLRYAAACGEALKVYSPEVYAELVGLADGAGLGLDEVVLLNLHEEIQYKGVIPKVGHCTAVAVGPPETRDGRTLVGQTWDWMTTVYGLSRVHLWNRERGPAVLAYGFPGLYCGAGLNAAGIALTWTSAGGPGPAVPGPVVGVPSYALLTHLLYQPTLAAVITEAKRVRPAGWFTFVLADGTGRLVNIEGSPKRVVVEEATGRMTRAGYGSRAMTATPDDRPPPVHPRCRSVCRALDGKPAAVDRELLQATFADPAGGVSAGKPTIDMMVFDCTAKVAHLSRGPSYKVAWTPFRFAAG